MSVKCRVFFFFDGPLQLLWAKNVWDLAIHLRCYQLKKKKKMITLIDFP